MPSDPRVSELVTLQELSQRFGVAYNRLYHMGRAGGLGAHISIGGTLLFHRAVAEPRVRSCLPA